MMAILRKADTGEKPVAEVARQHGVAAMVRRCVAAHPPEGDRDVAHPRRRLRGGIAAWMRATMHACCGRLRERDGDNHA